MKLLDKVGDALLAKLVPGIGANANCGQCRMVDAPWRCRRQCCRNGRQFYGEPLLDQCGHVCGWRCYWGLECYASC
jgi:hypothetical protein